MSDFETRLAQSLADVPRVPDEAFVAKIADLIGAEERARTLRLSIATMIAIVLAGVLCYGIALAWNATHALSIAPQTTISVAVAFLCALVVILSLPLAFARE
jgi:hypothetical protein